MGFVTSPDPEPHYCLWPTTLASLAGYSLGGRNLINHHFIQDGIIWRCDECGDLWISKKWPNVTRGMQTVGNRWVNVRNLGIIERWKVRRRANARTE